jgi:hypothetical protein
MGNARDHLAGASAGGTSDERQLIPTVLKLVNRRISRESFRARARKFASGVEKKPAYPSQHGPCQNGNRPKADCRTLSRRDYRTQPGVLTPGNIPTQCPALKGRKIFVIDGPFGQPLYTRRTGSTAPLGRCIFINRRLTRYVVVRDSLARG